MKHLRRTLLLAGVAGVLAGLAYAQVPPIGSNANGWLQAIFNILGDGVTTGGPRTPVTGVFSGADTTTAAASLAATAGKTNFVCDISIDGLGATAINNALATVTGLAGGNTLTYLYSMPVGATVPSVPVRLNFNPCKAASAVNTAITVTVPGAAGNTATEINVGGYQR